MTRFVKLSISALRAAGLSDGEIVAVIKAHEELTARNNSDDKRMICRSCGAVQQLIPFEPLLAEGD